VPVTYAHPSSVGTKNRALQLLNKGGGRRNPASKENPAQPQPQPQPSQPMAQPARDGDARQPQLNVLANASAPGVGLDAGSAFANAQWQF